MKGNEKLLKVLNDSLADGLTFINQYMIHGRDVQQLGLWKAPQCHKKAGYG